MKQTIQQAITEAERIVTLEDPLSAEEMTAEWLILFLATAYYFNDLAVEITQRISDITVIATQRKISVIKEQHSTSYGFNSGDCLCQYENLTDDLCNILNYLDTCFLRLR